MLAAVFALVGVVVGALVSGVVEWMLTRRRERVEGRAALRLVSSDLYTARALIHPVRETGAWGPEPTPFPFDAFREHRSVLAAQLDTDSWTRIEGSVLGIRHLAGIRASADDDERSYTPDELDHFERIGGYLDETLTHLERLTGRDSR